MVFDPEKVLLKVDQIHRPVSVGGEQGCGTICTKCREVWPCETITSYEVEKLFAQEREE